jgi:aspartate/methionine/tyrosine aminotransferase
MDSIFSDSPCVTAYQRVRRGVDASSQIGYGRNLFPPCPQLVEHIDYLVRAVVSNGRALDYSTRHDQLDAEIAAGLCRELLGRDDIEGRNIVFTSGATEGISLTCAYLSMTQFGVALPLPCYYAFEQSSRRHGLPIVGYYNWQGQMHCSPKEVDKLALVDIAPNGVTGCLFSPPKTTNAAFRVVDTVFYVGGSRSNDFGWQAPLERAQAVDLERGCILATASKDLSIPGFRAGIIITRDELFLEYLRRDRFERSYSACILASQLMLTYLATVCTYRDFTAGEPCRFEFLSDLFKEHESTAIPRAETLNEVVQHLSKMRNRYQDNIKLFKDLAGASRFGDPRSGYSVLLELPALLCSPDQSLEWCNRVGVTVGLKLNPALMFGGDSDSWSSLYGNRGYVRGNVSVHPEALQADLGLLRVALETI